MQKVLSTQFLFAFFMITVFFKIEHQSSSSISWLFIFFPLFNLDVVFAIYIAMKLVKEFNERGNRLSEAMFKYWMNLVMIMLFFSFKLLISLRLEHMIHLSYTTIFLPLFILLVIINVSSFRLMFAY